MHSRSSCLFAIEPQRRAGVGDGEAPLRDRRRVGGNWLEAGINTSAQLGAWICEGRLGDGLAEEASEAIKPVRWAETNMVSGDTAKVTS